MNTDKKAIAAIAQKFLQIQIIETRGDDDLDMYDLNIASICDAIAGAIEYGRKSATNASETPATDTGKKYPITEAHTAAIELGNALADAISTRKSRIASENTNTPAQIALADTLNDLLNQALTIQGKLGRLAKAEK